MKKTFTVKIEGSKNKTALQKIYLTRGLQKVEKNVYMQLARKIILKTNADFLIDDIFRSIKRKCHVLDNQM